MLNFGVGGTGPVEQYLLWRGLAVKRHLRHVFYVHMTNDLHNVRSAAQRSGTPQQMLVWQGYGESRLGIRALSRLHLTYLALDVWRRLDVESVQFFNSMGHAKALAAFEFILRRWRREVEAGGGAFHVVLLPTPEGDRWFRRLESPSSWQMADLPRCFHEAIPGFDYADWRFVNDFHWNEAANMMAARCLYRHLEGALGLPERSDLALARALHAYYHAFQDHARFGGEAAWMPGPPWALPGPLADREADRIVARYQALGKDSDSHRQRVVDAVRVREPALRSVWNVHVSTEHRLVVYVKEPCAGGDGQDPTAGMFLRVRPFNLARLGPRDRPKGHRALDGLIREAKVRTVPSPRGGQCVLSVPLNRFPLLATPHTGQFPLLAAAHTGQYSATGDVLWEGEFPIDDAEDWNRVRAGHRREYRAIAETEPVARSIWDVHVLRERRELALLKAPCASTDGAGFFFLRALSAGGRGTHVEKWFTFHSISGQFATMFDDRCLMTAWLPDGQFDTVQVGEYAHDSGTLSWQARFYWDVDELRRTHAAVSKRRPDAAGAFAVYRREDALVYVREPCAEADIRRRFFLHVYAAQPEDGGERRVNLDFDFRDRGALFDGKCVALVALPEAASGTAAVARLRTGQFAPAGETWAVELGGT